LNSNNRIEIIILSSSYNFLQFLQWLSPQRRLAWPGQRLGPLSLFGHSAEAGETFPPPAQRRQPLISAVAGDEEAEAGARVRWRGGEPNLGFWTEGGSPVWAHGGVELGGR
jgi:hypothetical protein